MEQFLTPERKIINKEDITECKLLSILAGNLYYRKHMTSFNNDSRTIK